jgi:hypothetical protein
VLLGQFTYTQESFLVLSRKGLRMVELPLRVRGVREFGQSRVASNLWRYGRRTVGIMFSFIRDYSPAVLFNNASGAMLLASFGLGAFFLWHRWAAGQFSPHIWAGFVSAFLFGLSAMIFALGQVAEQLLDPVEPDRAMRAMRAPVSTLVTTSVQSTPVLTRPEPSGRKRTARHDSACTSRDVTAPAASAVNSNVSTTPVIRPAAISARVGWKQTSMGCSPNVAHTGSRESEAMAPVRQPSGRGERALVKKSGAHG